MPDHTGRLVAYDDEMHLQADRPLAVGDTFEVIRGNGPREGDRMGTATVTSFEDGEPILAVLVGRTGHGKTWLGLALAHAVHGGGGDVGGMAGVRCRAGKALLVDAENGRRVLGQRFTAMGIGPDALVVVDGMGLHLPDDIGELRELVRATGATRQPRRRCASCPRRPPRCARSRPRARPARRSPAAHALAGAGAPIEIERQEASEITTAPTDRARRGRAHRPRETARAPRLAA